MSTSTLIVIQGAAFLILAAMFGFRSSRRLAWALVVILLMITGTLAMVWKRDTDRRVEARERLEESVPYLGRSEEGFSSSQVCRSCHPKQYDTWHISYHRTMTTLATPETVKGRFDDVILESRGRTYHLERRGDEFWVDMVDPDWERELRRQGFDPDARTEQPRVTRQIVMTTGSHHMQTHWVPSSFGREVYNLPFVFLFEQDRWIPREDVFLRPPGAGRFFALWNNSCIDCHSTAGKVGFDFEEELFDSQVAEMGIACEACHGPAAAHVGANRDPLRRYRYHLTDDVDATIVNPKRLSSRASSHVCGQCHGVSVSEGMDWLENGYRYRAGEDLDATRFMIRPAVDRSSEEMRELLERDPTALDTRFWSDGMVRVSGREFTGMAESGCYRRGELSCLSCHSMHESDPNDQLATGMSEDEACLQCHDSYRDRIEEHTHHPVPSEGSRCYNCHMPHTTYGLLKAIQSHWIDSPSVASSVQTGRPNACNLCHLDQTLAWTSLELERWYDIERVPLSLEESSVAASVLWLLRGDAGQRALIAWGMGWAPAREASGSVWLAPYLANLLTDPYSTVRFIAARSLRELPGYADLDYDFLDPPQEWVRAREEVLDTWFRLPVGSLDRTGAPILIDAQGNIDYDVFLGLARQRDDRPVILAE